MKTKDNIKNQLSDDELLKAFFAQAVEPVPDNGFTDRVMQRIEAMQTEETVQAHVATVALKRWNLWLNLTCVAAIVGLLAYMGFFGQAWHYLHVFANRVLVGILTFDPEALLVHLLLDLRQLPDLLPSANQLFTISLGLLLVGLIVMGQAVQKLKEMEW